jgi:hypothetical protein
VKKTLLFALSAVIAAAFGGPGSASAGTLTLHPAGFGQHSYSAWKAKEGLPDTSGGDNQALYFQKNTATTVFAAGVAVFKGFEQHPIPVQDLTGLGWWDRTDGHCGAGAPRFNIVVRPSGGGPTQTFFIGCQGMPLTGMTATAPNGTVYEQRSIAAPFASACCAPFPTSGFDVVGLAIVYDEGNDQGQCRNVSGLVSGQSCEFLDDIDVQTSDPTFLEKCWTSANDNSNQSTGPCPTPTNATSVTDTPSGLLDGISGLAVNPLDTELVNALAWAYPGVPLPAWLQYPNVIQ